MTDFDAVTKIATAPLLVLVRADSPLKTMADLVAMARKDPKAVSYGSFGNGSPSHLIGESINKQAGLQMTHVPYTGGGAALDLASGTLTVAILDALSMTPQVKAGKLRALAVSGGRRLPDLPQVPTFDELGLKDFQGNLWIGVLAPAGTPASVLQRLNDELQAALRRPDVRNRMGVLGFEPLPGPPAALTTHMQAVQDAWARVVRERRISTE